MPITILDQDEKLLFQSGDVKIYYRRIPRSVLSRFVKASTRRGETDWMHVSDQALQYAILDWDGFVDKAGKPVPYSPELIDAVPSGILNEFTDTLLDGTSFEVAAKNSRTSSRSD